MNDKSNKLQSGPVTIKFHSEVMTVMILGPEIRRTACKAELSRNFGGDFTLEKC